MSHSQENRSVGRRINNGKQRANDYQDRTSELDEVGPQSGGLIRYTHLLMKDATGLDKGLKHASCMVNFHPKPEYGRTSNTVMGC